MVDESLPHTATYVAKKPVAGDANSLASPDRGINQEVSATSASQPEPAPPILSDPKPTESEQAVDIAALALAEEAYRLYRSNEFDQAKALILKSNSVPLSKALDSRIGLLTSWKEFQEGRVPENVEQQRLAIEQLLKSMEDKLKALEMCWYGNAGNAIIGEMYGESSLELSQIYFSLDRIFPDESDSYLELAADRQRTAKVLFDRVMELTDRSDVASAGRAILNYALFAKLDRQVVTDILTASEISPTHAELIRLFVLAVTSSDILEQDGIMRRSYLAFRDSSAECKSELEGGLQYIQQMLAHLRESRNQLGATGYHSTDLQRQIDRFIMAESLVKKILE